MKTAILLLLLTFSSVCYSVEICRVNTYYNNKYPKSVFCTDSEIQTRGVDDSAAFVKSLLENGYKIDSTLNGAGGYIFYTLIKN